MPNLIGAYGVIGEQGVPATAVSGEWNTVEINMSGGGEGDLEVQITGAGNTESNIEYRNTGLAIIHYRMMQSGDYYITILFNNEPVDGSPFKTVIQKESKVIVDTSTNSTVQNLT